MKIKSSDYGIDAPSVIITLISTAIVMFFISCFGVNYLYQDILYCFYITIVINIIFAILMLYSSKVGKLKARDYIISKLSICGDEQVLDVGCGRGLLLIGIAKKLNTTGKAYGIDIWSQKDLSNNGPDITKNNAQLESVLDKVEIVTGDMTHMDFNSDMFDIIVSSMAIHNISKKEIRAKAIKEIARVLKPSGKLVIQDFQFIAEYKDLLLTLGFKSIEVSKYNFMMFPPVRVLMAEK